MIPLIQVATKSESNEERKQAERKIIQLRELHPEEYFKQTIEAFSSKQVPLNIRESAGTLIAVSVVTKSKTGTYIWDSLNGAMKTNVKNSSLEALIDSERGIRRTAANIVSSICYVELPRKQWEGIVEKICANINHDSQIVKESSILTLGFICSRMKQLADFQFDGQAQDSILSGIILGLQQTQPLIIDTALKALRDSISSLTSTLTNAQYRQFVLKQLVDIINSEKYVVEGLQILGQFVKSCYESLGEYMDGLVQLLDPIVANSKNQDACVAAMEVLENVAAEYKELSDDKNTVVNYITGNTGQKIVASLLKNLSVMEDGDENDDNPISDSASKALQTIFQNGSTEYKLLVLQFVKMSIAQNDWKHRQASIKGFSLLLYGLSDGQNQTLISSSINQLMGLLNDKSKQVQYATMESLIIITQVCGKFFLTSQLFVQYLKLILSKLSISQKFLKSGCRIVDNLCESERDYKLGKFSTISDDLIGLFLKYALSSQTSLAIVGWCTITIMNIIEVTNNTAVILKYLAFILDNFDNISQVKDVERREVITSAFFTFMQFCLHGLKQLKLQESVIGAVYNKVTNTFKTNSDVNSDGLYAIEALVSFFNGNLALVNDFWGYIIHALQKWQDPVLFRATISCIASFVTTYGDTLADRLNTFVPVLLELLENPSFGKQLKIDCLVLLGEVFLSCGKAAEPYLQKFLQVLLLCCAAAIQMTDTDFTYSQLLKDNIVQALMCIVHGLNSENNINPNLAPFIPQLFQFAAISCNKKHRPTVSYLKKCVLLMADFVKFYPSVVKPLKQEAFIEDCLNTLKGFNKSGEYTQIINYVKQQFK